MLIKIFAILVIIIIIIILIITVKTGKNNFYTNREVHTLQKVKVNKD